MTFMIPAGFSSASGTLVGNSIGEGSPPLVMQYYQVSMFCATIVSFATIAGLMVFEEPIIGMFTDGEGVLQHMKSAWPVLLIFVVFDSTQAIGGSVMRATANQGTAAFITSTAYWAVGIPASALFCFYWEFDLFGMWIGPTLATAINTMCYTILISRMNWGSLI